MMCPPCHPAGGDEHKSQWGVGNTTLVLSLLTFIHAAVISVPKLLRKACRIGLNWYWNVLDKRLEDSHSGLKEDKKALHKRVTTPKETLEHKAKVEVGEGVLRQRRQPGKEWSKDEIGGGEGSQ
ncbi:hypothetical protein N7524_011252 [Penicillium chrysogenum]|nr:hypothetical protein N7524_011252 [Penicillium chrysogenum]